MSCGSTEGLFVNFGDEGFILRECKNAMQEVFDADLYVDKLAMSSTTTSDYDYDGFFIPNFVDPFEICSSSLLIITYIPTFWLFFKISRFYAQKGFKSAFQLIFYIYFVNDVELSIVQLFAYRLPSWGIWGWFEGVQTGFFPRLLYHLQKQSKTSQSFACFVVALNRLTCILYPANGEDWWDQVKYPLLVLMYVTPLIYWARVWWEQPIFVQYSNAAFYLHGINDSDYSLQIMIIVMIFVFLAFAVNTATGIALWRHFSRMNNKTRKTETRFYAMSLIMFLTQVMAVGTQFLASCLPQSNFQYWVLEVGPIFGDFNCFFPLYFLIAVSNEWRAMVFEESKQQLVSSLVRSATSSTAISRKTTNWGKNGKETIVD